MNRTEQNRTYTLFTQVSVLTFEDINKGQGGKYLACSSQKRRKKYIYCNTGPLLKLFIGRGDDDNDN